MTRDGPPVCVSPTAWAGAYVSIKISTNASLFGIVTELLCRGLYVATQCQIDAIVHCTIS